MDDDIFEDIIAFDVDSTDSTENFEIGDIFINNIHTITNYNKREDAVNKLLIESVECVNRILKTIDDILISRNSDIKAELVENLQHCIYILDALISFLSHIKTFSSIDVSCYESLPKSILKILMSFFVHCKNGETIYSVYFKEIGTNITGVFKKCSELQSLYFDVVIDVMKFNLILEDHLSTFLEILDIVSNIGEIVISLDAKTMAVQWKGYVKLCEKYVDWINDKFIHQRATAILCKTLENNINDLTSNKTPETKDVKRWLKISNFILQILVRMTELFGGNISRNTDHFVSCIVFIYQNSPLYLPQTNVKPALVEAIRSHISVGADLLLINLLSNEYFRSNFMDTLRSLAKNHSLQFGCIFSIITVIKSLLNVSEEVRKEWVLEDSENIICVLFDIINLCSMEFLKNITFEVMPISKISLYDYILIHTACLAISCPNLSVIERKMFESVLNPNIWLSVFICDLWPILARYGSKDLCFDQLAYLIEVYEELRIANTLSNTPHEIYLSCLIGRLFKLLPKKSKLSVLNKYPLWKHLDLWRIIGLCNLEEEHTLIESVNKSNAIMREFVLDDQINQENLTNMIQHMKLIPTIPFSVIPQVNKYSEPLISNVINVWNYVMLSKKLSSNLTQKEVSVSGSQWLHDFVILLLNVTTCLSSYLNNQAWLIILRILSTYLEMTNSTIKIGILKVIKALIYCETINKECSGEVFVSMKRLLEALLKDDNATVRLITMESFIHISVTAINEKIVTNIKTKTPLTNLLDNDSSQGRDHLENAYFQSLQCNYIHKCEISTKSNNSQNLARFNDRNPKEEINMAVEMQMLSRINNVKANFLKIMTQKKHLNTDHKNRLREIITIIDDIIDENVISSD